MRIAFGIAALALTIFAPYWIYLPAIFVGIILFPLYLEAVFLGLLIDLIYGMPGAFPFGFAFGFVAAVLVMFAVPLRERLRFNA